MTLPSNSNHGNLQQWKSCLTWQSHNTTYQASQPAHPYRLYTRNRRLSILHSHISSTALLDEPAFPNRMDQSPISHPFPQRPKNPWTSKNMIKLLRISMMRITSTRPLSGG